MEIWKIDYRYVYKCDTKRIYKYHKLDGDAYQFYTERETLFLTFLYLILLIGHIVKTDGKWSWE